ADAEPSPPKKNPRQLALPGVCVVWNPDLFRHDVGRLRTLGGINQFKLHCLPFLQVLEAVARNARVMHEHIGATLLLNESKTLFRIEPLHFSRCHSVSIHLSSFSPVWQNTVPKPSERRCTSKDFARSIKEALPLSTL